MIRMNGSDNSFQRVVEEGRTNTDFISELEIVRRAEERFVLADGLAFVI
jgi:hypothetical protein